MNPPPPPSRRQARQTLAPQAGRRSWTGRIRGHWAMRSLAGSGLIALGLAGVAVFSLGADVALQGEIITLFINVLIVVAIQVFSGNTGILSLGHLAFVGIGAYVAGILMLDPSFKDQLTGLPPFLQDNAVPFLPAILIAAVVAGLVALVAGIPLMRLSGPAAVIAILSLLLISNVIFSGWTGVTRGADGLYGIPEATTVGWALLGAVGGVAAARLFRDSSPGLQLQATREDALAAAAIGVSVFPRRLSAWGLSAFLAGGAGALSAAFLTAFSPSNFFLQQTFIAIVMLIVGGLGTVSGAVLGAGLVTVLQEALRGYEGTRVDVGFIHLTRLTGLTQLVLALVILATMYLRPRGIVALREFDDTLALWIRRWRGDRGATQALEAKSGLSGELGGQSQPVATRRDV